MHGPGEYRDGGQASDIDDTSNPGFPDFLGRNCDVPAWNVLSPFV